VEERRRREEVPLNLEEKRREEEKRRSLKAFVSSNGRAGRRRSVSELSPLFSSLLFSLAGSFLRVSQLHDELKAGGVVVPRMSIQSSYF